MRRLMILPVYRNSRAPSIKNDKEQTKTSLPKKPNRFGCGPCFWRRPEQRPSPSGRGAAKRSGSALLVLPRRSFSSKTRQIQELFRNLLFHTAFRTAVHTAPAANLPPTTEAESEVHRSKAAKSAGGKHSPVQLLSKRRGCFERRLLCPEGEADTLPSENRTRKGK